MSFLAQCNENHKAIQRRIAARAAAHKASKQARVETANPKPKEEWPQSPRDAWAERQIEKHKGYWFSIVSSKLVVVKPSAPSIKDIQRATCKVFGVEMDALLGKRQTKDIARPRQVSMYLARKLTGLSQVGIGKATGGRDHATVIHAINVVPGFIKSDGELAQKVERIREMLA